jgi:DNA-binding response OmpR family regulator
VVLVVDDEHIIADTMAEILIRHGMTGLAAYSFEGAMKLAQSSPPDLLLSDVIMPGKTGIELAIAIKSIYGKCRILLISGQATTLELLAGSRQAGHSFALLQKPIHPAELLERIDAALQLAPTPKHV